LLVGSARGIGEATVRKLAKNGASILIVDILEEQAKKVADDLSKGNLNFI
jgi:NAD(P)-dependent dehydrogenase (short-subunit alcohol dehydrogenase family)